MASPKAEVKPAVTYTRKKPITVPFWSLPDLGNIRCRILGRITEHYVAGFMWSTDGRLPCVLVKNLSDNKNYLMIVPGTLAATLTSNVENTYIGKCFDIEVFNIEGSNRREIAVYELDEVPS